MDTSLDSWLARVGLSRGQKVGDWRLGIIEARETTGDGEKELGVTIGFVSDEPPVREISAQLVMTDPGRRAFARTASFDLSHGPVDAALMPDAARLLRQVHAIVAARDPGQLPPPPVKAEPVAEPMVAASEEAATTGSAGGASDESAADAGPYGFGSAKEPDDDPALRVGDGEHFLEWLMIDAKDLARVPSAIPDMIHGRLGGMIIRGAFSEAEMARAVARIDERQVAFSQTFFPARFKSHFLGRSLDGSDPRLTEYLEIAARFHDQTRAAFEGGADYQTRLEEILSSINGGRVTAVPRFPDGRPYAESTVRVLPPGGQIGSHCGNEASTRPAYTHLNTIVNGTDQVSFFLTLQAPESGGELVVYALQWSHIDESNIREGHSNVDALLPRARWEAYSPGAGDLLIFDGGRYFHRVSVVHGERTRWTIGGFMMLSADDQTLYYWS